MYDFRHGCKFYNLCTLRLLNRSWIKIPYLHTDMDPGISKIKYILSGDGAGTIFVINDKTGDIHAMKRLDREEKAEYTLTAQAVDRDTNKPLEPPSEFIIKVQDINDNPPEFVDGPYHATVPEMSLVGIELSFPNNYFSSLGKLNV
uniref:Cadherin domain-containing protein n=1 Tax=Laticauda laticaudata TaxID=8630 RepID=A0A8C5WX49_LATLA